MLSITPIATVIGGPSRRRRPPAGWSWGNLYIS